MPVVHTRTSRMSDLPGLLLTGRRIEQLHLPLIEPYERQELLRSLRPSVSSDEQARVAVASVNGSLAAWLAYAPHGDPHVWQIAAAGAGNRRLRPNDDVSAVLWSTLLEFAISDAGAHGARRLFAAATSDAPGWHALQRAGFEMYGYATQLHGVPDVDRAESPAGFRSQEPSDVWGIQQLYQRATPRVVQFAEALTSRTWEVSRQRAWDRVRGRLPRTRSWVVEQRSEMTVYCRLDVSGRTHVISWIAEPEHRHQVIPAILASLRASGISRRTCLVLVPGFCDELLPEFEACGFVPERQADLMVRPTTVATVIRARPVLLPMDRRERLMGTSPSRMSQRPRRRSVPGPTIVLP